MRYQEIMESDNPVSLPKRQDYWAAIRPLENELDYGREVWRGKVRHYNPQEENVTLALNTLNRQLAPGHYVEWDKVNTDRDATQALTTVFNKDGFPVVEVSYKRFNEQATGIFEYEGNLELSPQFKAASKK